MSKYINELIRTIFTNQNSRTSVPKNQLPGATPCTLVRAPSMLFKSSLLLAKLREASSPVFWWDFESSLLVRLRVQSFGKTSRSFESGLLVRLRVQSFGGITSPVFWRRVQSFGEITSPVFWPDRTKFARKEAYMYKVLLIPTVWTLLDISTYLTLIRPSPPNF